MDGPGLYNLESELAYWLEHAASGDLRLQRLLAERYGAELYRFALALSQPSAGPGGAAVGEQAWELVEAVFRRAGAEAVSFRGQASVRAWLFSLLLEEQRRLKSWRRWSWLSHLLERLPRRAASSRTVGLIEVLQHPWQPEIPAAPAPRDETESALWRLLDDLPNRLRLPAFLRYALRLSVPEIAGMLRLGSGEVQRRLHQVRCQAGRALTLGGAEAGTQPGIAPANIEHGQALDLLRRELDGLLDSGGPARRQLEQHLEECAACRRQARLEQEVEAGLGQALSRRYPLPALPSPGLDYLAGLVALQPGPQRGWRGLASGDRAGSFLPVSCGEAFLISLVLLAIALGASFLLRRGPASNRPLYPPTPGPTPSPLALEAPVERSVLPLLQAGATTSRYHYWEADLSADGRWVAFTLQTSRLSGVLTVESHVYLYERQTAKITPVDINRDGALAGGSAHSPAVSRDGRYVVFVSDAPELAGGQPTSCLYAGEPHRCFEVFLYDRRMGRVTPVSRSPTGAPPNWHALRPAISGDGQRIAFWSAATNLGDDASGGTPCSTNLRQLRCWDLFVYEREGGRMTRFPVGRQESDELLSLDRLSLSENGRWLAYTVRQGDLYGESMLDGMASQAFVLNTQVNRLYAINLNARGEPGNGASANPTLTPDGRFVVFASQANDLVEGDANGVADVFLRDLRLGQTRLVSPGSNGDSGAFFPDVHDSAARLAVSDNGRYIAFVSTTGGSLLGMDSTTGRQACLSGYNMRCYNVFLHDTLAGSTHLALGQSSTNALHLFPDLSSDGAWLSLINSDLECPRAPLCAALALRELSTGQITLLTAQGESEVGRNPLGWQRGPYLAVSWGGINSLAFSPDGRWLATGSHEGRISIWEVENGRQQHRLPGRNLPVAAVAFSPDGAYLAGAWRDGAVRLYATETLAGSAAPDYLVTLQGRGASILSLAFSPDSNLLTVGAVGQAWSAIRVEGESPQRFAFLDSDPLPGVSVNALAYSPRGDLLALGLSDGSLWLRRLQDYALVGRLSARGPVLSLAFSPQGDFLAAGDQAGQVNVWQVARRGERYELKHRLRLQHGEWVRGLSFSPDGQTLAVGALQGGVTLWRMPDGELQLPFLGSRWDQAFCLAFTPDGRRLAVGSTWGSVQLWLTGE